MSPAKRLSRQRFRALCERCRAYCTPGHMLRRDEVRVARFSWRSRRATGAPMFTQVRALARLAR